jgi:hypothetical protein
MRKRRLVLDDQLGLAYNITCDLKSGAMRRNHTTFNDRRKSRAVEKRTNTIIPTNFGTFVERRTNELRAAIFRLNRLGKSFSTATSHYIDRAAGGSSGRFCKSLVILSASLATCQSRDSIAWYWMRPTSS